MGPTSQEGFNMSKKSKAVRKDARKSAKASRKAAKRATKHGGKSTEDGHIARKLYKDYPLLS